MKLTIVIPVISDAFTEEVRKEVAGWVSPGTEIDVRRIARGTASIESEYDEALAAPGILDAVRAAAEDGADAVFISCFGDPGVHAAREIVDIPVVGGFEPAVLTSLALGEKAGVITVLPNVLPMLHSLVRRYGLTERLGPIRVVDIPVLDLTDPERLVDRLAEQARAAVDEREADVIVLGCTGMIGVARALQERLAQDGPFVPVVDPTGAAVTWLESQVRLGVRPSRTTYMTPPAKDRNI
ncbi:MULTISPECIES: aspartate/glutamate racemase family protein [unclassified Streptomyces]|uniref:aspartate/glutamate racemase family protein n=1 Tax=unclassified Streptomyces TaxID=2593676 RepID=UPI0036E48F2D